MLSSHFQKVGDYYGNYRITRLVPLSEIQSTIIELEHEPTGALIIAISNDDEENLFNLSFRTWPEKSNGAAHILEHTVLCGSEKFPIRDPFFSMGGRSLNTFLNAMTGADFTCYPAASQVPKDFYNLLDVYLNAVFKPTLSKLSFLQEGHRLEFLNPLDPSSPLVFNGIVFNEMKGALATADARLGEALMSMLYPDITYGVNSGGDPKEIINLTYEELKAFHAKYYHPSRCLFYFYGNLPLEGHLDFLEEHAFKGVQKVSPLPLMSKQPRFKEKKTKTLTYPISKEEDPTNKTCVGMGWLTCSILEHEELLALSVLDVVLMGTDAAPLKMALLKSNLCKQVDSLIDNDMSEVPFLLVCKGCPSDSANALEGIVRSVLTQLVKEGVPEYLIEAALHQIEMSRKEITGHSSPYGLSLFFRSALLKQHGGNPEDGLKIHTLFEVLNEKVKDSHYLPSLIEKHFLHNPHFITVVMHPDKELAAQESKEEQERLSSIFQALKEEDMSALIEQSKELIAYQESAEENIDILPKVSLNDVAKEGKEFALQVENIGKLNCFLHPCFTNDIVYIDLVFDLPKIEEIDLPFLRLFTLFLPQMGCGGRSYQEHLEYLLAHTGGIGVSLDLCLQAEDPTQMRPSLSLRAKAINRKLDKLFPLLKEMLTSVDFTDQERLKELLMQHFHGLENSIHHSSLRYATNLAARGLSVPSKIINSWYGLDYFWAIKEVVSEFEKAPQKLIEKMQYLQNLCLGLEGGDLVLSCDEETYSHLKEKNFYGLQDFKTHSFSPWDGNYSVPKPLSQGCITASPVAFTAMLFPCISYIHPDAPVLSIAAHIMEDNTLHIRIREQGGAYGSGAVNGVLSGQFYFYSYRDPNIASTLEAFKEAAGALAIGEFDLDDIEEAKLGLFQDLDAPTPPGSRGITAYSRLRGGRTAALRQRFREKLFLTGQKEIQQAVQKDLLTGMEKAVIVSFADKKLLEKENALLKEKALPLFSI